MPDYNLGRAHGTIRVDYDGRGVQQADDDLKKLGDTTQETSQKTTQSIDRTSATYDQLGAAARRLEQEVSRAAAAEISARARATAAQQHLVQVQGDAQSSAKDLLDAQKQATAELKRYETAVLRAHTANRALASVQRDLASQRRPDLTPRGDDSRFADIVHHLRNIDDHTRKSAFGLNAFSGRLRAAIALASIASPAVAGLGVSLVSLTGLVGVAAGAIAGLVAVAGTLATAMAGVGQVFKVANQQAAGAGQSAVQLASQQRAAARQIEQAVRAVRDAEEGLQETRLEAARAAQRAARQILQAERSLRDAQVDAARAQDNLTRARREAARQIEDLRAALVGGALDERQAILDVQRAQEELDQVRADPRSSKTDLAQAILNLERQQHQLQVLQNENRRLQQESAETAAAGVSGSERVVDAQRDVVRSQELVGDAQVDLREAVADAAKQQVDSQRDVRDAVEAVGDAQRDLAEAYLQAQEVGASAAAKMADALANVSPQAREFVQAILAQRDAWTEVKFAVQDALFAGLAQEIAPLANTWLPLLRDGMVGIASELRGLILELIAFLKTGEATSEVVTIFHSTRDAVDRLTPGITALLDAILTLSSVGSTFLPGLAQGFSDWATNVARVADESAQAGTMQEWMRSALDTAHDLWTLLGNVASIVSTIFSAFDQAGGGALETLVQLTDRLDTFLKTAEGQAILQALGKTLAALGQLLGDVLLGALQALGPAFVALAPTIQLFAQVLGQQILVTAQILAPVLQLIANILAFMGPVLAPLVASFVLLNKAILIGTAAWRVLNAVMNSNPFLAIIAIVIALTTLIIQNWDSIKNALAAAWQFIADLAADVWEGIRKAIVEPVTAAIQFYFEIWTNFINWIVGVWNDLTRLAGEIFSRVKSAIVDPVQSAVESVVKFFRDLPGKIIDFFKGASQWLWQAGVNIIQGLLDGIGAMVGRVWDYITSIGDRIGDVFSNVLDIFSPSRVFEKFGEFTMRGYVVGLEDTEPDVLARVAEIAHRVVAAGDTERFAPAGIVPPSRTVPDAFSSDDATTGRTVTVQTLVLHVAGNLDPTNRVEWRRAIKSIKKSIEEVDRSDEP